MLTFTFRWQLLEKTLTLEEFNSLPKVSPNFFDFNLKIRSKPQNPVVFRISTEIKIGSHEAMRYKYKLYPSDELENSSLNHYVFCCLKEDRLVGSFAVSPPIEGRFFLKVCQNNWIAFWITKHFECKHDFNCICFARNYENYSFQSFLIFSIKNKIQLMFSFWYDFVTNLNSKLVMNKIKMNNRNKPRTLTRYSVYVSVIN